MVLLSIIVPVYNVESYIDRCLQSILKIQDDSIEIILVDDGSTDSSGRLCDRYAHLQSNIKVIHKENGGLSDARNAGLKESTGQYIWFVDSDDSVEFDMNEFKNIIKSSPDIICANYKIINGKSEHVISQDCLSGLKNCSGIEALKLMLTNNQYYVPVWKYIYSLDFFRINEFEFQKGIFHEDEQLTPYLFLKAKKTMYFPFVIYNYYIRENSISNSTKWEKNIADIFTVFYANATYFDNNVNDIDLKRLLLNDIVKKMIYHLNHYRVPYKTALNYIDRSFVMKNSYKIKDKIRAYIYLKFPEIYYWLFTQNEKRKIKS